MVGWSTCLWPCTSKVVCYLVILAFLVKGNASTKCSGTHPWHADWKYDDQCVKCHVCKGKDTNEYIKCNKDRGGTYENNYCCSGDKFNPSLATNWKYMRCGDGPYPESCPELIAEQGQWHCTIVAKPFKFAYLSTCTLTCDHGVVEDSKEGTSVTCGSDLKWSTTPAKCHIVRVKESTGKEKKESDGKEKYMFFVVLLIAVPGVGCIVWYKKKRTPQKNQIELHQMEESTDRGQNIPILPSTSPLLLDTGEATESLLVHQTCKESEVPPVQYQKDRPQKAVPINYDVSGIEEGSSSPDSHPESVQETSNCSVTSVDETSMNSSTSTTNTEDCSETSEQSTNFTESSGAISDHSPFSSVLPDSSVHTPQHTDPNSYPERQNPTSSPHIQQHEESIPDSDSVNPSQCKCTCRQPRTVHLQNSQKINQPTQSEVAVTLKVEVTVCPCQCNQNCACQSLPKSKPVESHDERRCRGNCLGKKGAEFSCGRPPVENSTGRDPQLKSLPVENNCSNIHPDSNGTSVTNGIQSMSSRRNQDYSGSVCENEDNSNFEDSQDLMSMDDINDAIFQEQDIAHSTQLETGTGSFYTSEPRSGDQEEFTSDSQQLVTGKGDVSDLSLDKKHKP